MLVPISRSEEDMDDLFTDDFFWMHERGVDLIFITLYMHFLRKYYVGAYSFEQEIAWKSGAFAFLLTHGVIFFGLVLCSTHLSDITLRIASNIMFTFTLRKWDIYVWLFTDQTLNTDSLIRMMYAHYCLAFLLVYISICHALVMHYDWKDSKINNDLNIRIKWFLDLFRTEFSGLIMYLLIFVYISKLLYSDCEPLHNELFTFGDVGILNDVRFMGVMPHWYFRGYMGWLILCPHHYAGILGLVLFMVLIYYQPEMKKKNYILRLKKESFSLINLLLTIGFSLNLIYCDSLLPYGRFYNRLGGNKALMIAYFYIFLHLIFNYKYIVLDILKITNDKDTKSFDQKGVFTNTDNYFIIFLYNFNIYKRKFDKNFSIWVKPTLKLHVESFRELMFIINDKWTDTKLYRIWLKWS